MYIQYSGNNEIYLGINAGKDNGKMNLLGDLNNAEKSILIVSPYLSEGYIHKLINIKEKRDIDIYFITSDNIEGFWDNRVKKRKKYENIKKLVKLYRKKTTLSEDNKFKSIYRYLKIIFFIILSLIIGVSMLQEKYFLLWAILPLISISFIFKILVNYICIFYDYDFKEFIPFRIFYSQYKNKNNGVLLHSKIYIIDNKIAYIGSLNYTYSGFKNNYETIIRTTHKFTIEKLKKEFDNLFYFYNNYGFPNLNFKTIGKKIYKRPRFGLRF